jgi:Uma2 family endonuclease
LALRVSPWYEERVNIHSPFARREPVLLTADAFWLLKSAGVFSEYSKAELLDGALFGVPVQSDAEPESDASFPIKLRRRDYHLLTDAGLLDDREKTELVDGVVYGMSPQYRRHGFIKDELAYRLRRALEDLGSPLRVATEQSVAIDAFNEPQPDIILTAEPKGDGPIPLMSVAMLVEVSASTLTFDLTDKTRIYARAGIMEYWVVDANRRVVHQLWSPEGDAYDHHRETALGQKIEIATIRDVDIETDAL